MNITIRNAVEADLNAIKVIEKASFPDPWREKMFLAHLSGEPHIFIVAEGSLKGVQKILGFAVVRGVAEEAELLNIAVDRKMRGHGVGTTLLDSVIKRCIDAKVERLLLEVRESNHEAQALYRRFSFMSIGKRPGYYRSPSEDAIIFELKLSDITGNHGNL